MWSVGSNVENTVLLIKAGASINQKSIDGKTALHYAVNNYGDIRNLKTLVESGADITIEDSLLRVPALLAVNENVAIYLRSCIRKSYEFQLPVPRVCRSLCCCGDTDKQGRLAVAISLNAGRKTYGVVMTFNEEELWAFYYALRVIHEGTTDPFYKRTRNYNGDINGQIDKIPRHGRFGFVIWNKEKKLLHIMFSGQAIHASGPRPYDLLQDIATAFPWLPNSRIYQTDNLEY